MCQMSSVSHSPDKMVATKCKMVVETRPNKPTLKLVVHSRTYAFSLQNIKHKMASDSWYRLAMDADGVSCQCSGVLIIADHRLLLTRQSNIIINKCRPTLQLQRIICIFFVSEMIR